MWLIRTKQINSNIDELNFSCKNGHLEVVKFLHSIGVKCSGHAIDRASLYGHLEVVKFLHSIECPFSEDSILWASKKRHLEVVEFLKSIK